MSKSSEGNGRTKVAIEFDLGDLPALVYALQRAATSAFMYSRPGAQERLNQYRQRILDIIPEPARLFQEFVWCEMALALSNCTSWTIRHDPTSDRYYRTEGYVVIVVDGQEYRSSNSSCHTNGPEMASVRAVVEELAPPGAEFVEEADEKPHRR